MNHHIKVPETGVEPVRLLGHTDLNRAHLPIPPPGRFKLINMEFENAMNFIEVGWVIKRNKLGER